VSGKGEIRVIFTYDSFSQKANPGWKNDNAATVQKKIAKTGQCFFMPFGFLMKENLSTHSISVLHQIQYNFASG
jgi:hypothetical protein